MDADVLLAEMEEQVDSDRARPLIYRTDRPPPPLVDLVESFWYYDGYQPPHARERVLPFGAMQLIISLCDDPLRVFDRLHHPHPRSLRGPVICGAHAEPVIIGTAGQASIMGVQFKPGGAAPFLGVAAGELRDADLSLDLLWGARAGELRERLRDAGAPEVKFYILAQSLVAHLTRPVARRPAIAAALRAFHGGPHMRPISAVTADSGFSARRFIQLFEAEVGLTPKVYCRIQRFQRVLRHMSKGPQSTGADLAAACGYCDQAHLIHDFRAFSGLTPTDYLARRGAQRNHVPLDA